MRQKVYTSYDSGEKEYYDLATDPYQLHNALGAGDTLYPPPEARSSLLRAAFGCPLRLQRPRGSGSCSEAENAPPLPTSTAP